MRKHSFPSDFNIHDALNIRSRIVSYCISRYPQVDPEHIDSAANYAVAKALSTFNPRKKTCWKSWLITYLKLTLRHELHNLHSHTSTTHISLHTLNDSDNVSLPPQLVSPDFTQDSINKCHAQVISRLCFSLIGPREQSILKDRFWDKLTYREIAERRNLSPFGVQYIERNTLVFLRDRLTQLGITA